MRASPPTRPPGIRFAQPGDEQPLFDMFMLAYAENGWGGVDTEEVRRVIAAAIDRRDGHYMIAVIPGPDHLEAVFGLQPSRNWYGDQDSWYWTELLVYVHREHRRSRHAVTLMRFAQWFEDIAGAPVLICLMAREDQQRKRRFFSRFGREVTSVFMLGSGTFRYAQKRQAEAA